MERFWLKRAAAWSKGDIAVVAILVLWAVGWLLLNIRAIEHGDPVTHWDRINRLLAGDALEVDEHHDARFTIYVPVLILRLFLGDHPNLYYLAPVAAFVVLVATTYWLGSRIFDRRVGLVAAMVLVLFPQSLRAGSQLLPGGFEAAFVVLSSYFVLTWTGSERQMRRFLLAALLLFVGYLAKIQVLLYAPGLAIAVWLVSRSRRAAAAFSLAVVGLVGLEAVVYAVAPWEPGSRVATFDVLLARYLPILDSPLDLFERFSSLPVYWLWGFIVAGVGAVLTWRFLDDRGRGFLLIPASFLTLITFGVSSLDPLQPLVHFEARFLTSVIPFLLLFLAFLVFQAGDLVRRALPTQSRIAAVFTVLVVAGLPVLWFVSYMDPLATATNSTEGRHPWALNDETYIEVGEAIDEARPVILQFDLADGTDDELRDNAKRLRYLAVFFFPFESAYRAACYVDADTQLVVLAPASVYEGTPDTAATRLAEAGDPLLIDPDPDARWWRYRVDPTPWSEIDGSDLLTSGSETEVLTVRELGDWGLAQALCEAHG